MLVGPRVELGLDRVAADVAYALAGPEGSVVTLTEIGVRNLGRPMTAAEVAWLRKALSVEDGVVGYVCRGRPVTAVERPAGAASSDGAVSSEVPVAVATDHANLTWRSPLTGPNDDQAGPRFPSMTGIYAAEAALDSLKALDGIIVRSGVVAGVSDDARPSAFEVDVARAQGHTAVSSELVPVAIVAAHLGLRVAAVVLMAGS
ncbi:MAG: hypothetical protein JXA87_07395 [Thermoleophilia bacterium]|nr:hypothetical protein [Thermoleophilia bacterium]